jgi:hypothetical protein
MSYSIDSQRLEDWPWSLGCKRISCPTMFICVWQAPDGHGHFTAPNPDYVYFIPDHQKPGLGKILDNIMNGRDLS